MSSAGLPSRLQCYTLCVTVPVCSTQLVVPTLQGHSITITTTHDYITPANLIYTIQRERERSGDGRETFAGLSPLSSLFRINLTIPSHTLSLTHISLIPFEWKTATKTARDREKSKQQSHFSTATSSKFDCCAYCEVVSLSKPEKKQQAKKAKKEVQRVHTLTLVLYYFQDEPISGTRYCCCCCWQVES